MRLEASTRESVALHREGPETGMFQCKRNAAAGDCRHRGPLGRVKGLTSASRVKGAPSAAF
jgi:hypothetical protein